HIANRHGVSQRDLVEANPELKKNPDMLRLGQELDVCAAKKLAEDRGSGSSDDAGSSKKPRARSCGSGGQTVEPEVARGETLGKLAPRPSGSEKEIQRRNPKLSKE